MGWEIRDDWFKGEWQTADTIIERKVNEIAIYFNPLATSEFPDLEKDYNVSFRQTMKLRVRIPESLIQTADIKVFTDTLLVFREDISHRSRWGFRAGG